MSKLESITYIFSVLDQMKEEADSARKEGYFYKSKQIVNDCHILLQASKILIARVEGKK